MITQHDQETTGKNSKEAKQKGKAISRGDYVSDLILSVTVHVCGGQAVK